MSWNDVYQDYIAQKTAELNANYLSSITVDSSDSDYRGNDLPNGYTQIEYLQSTGTQWIDTNVCPDYKTNFEIDFLTTNAISSSYNVDGSGYGYIFGSDGARLSLNTYPATNGGELYYFNRAINPYITSGVRTQISLMGNVFTTSNGIQNIDRGSFSASSTTLKLFSGASRNQWGHVKLYSLKIYDNETLVRDFIPCYDSNKVFGLYDVVGDQFYTNQGTGIFNTSVTYTYPINGSGTESDPYKISSAMDFAYFAVKTNENSKFLQNKHLIFTKDLEFNDGYFEDNGTYHDGGDGKLYTHSMIKGYYYTYIEGNGYTIKNPYDASLFSGHIILSNLNVKGFTSTGASVFASISSSTLENIILSGNINSSGGAIAVASGELSNAKMKKVVTYININAGGTVAGFNGFCGTPYFEDCINYGNLNSSGSANVSGFTVDNFGTKGIFKNCKNFGNLSGTICTGIANGIRCNQGAEFINCENHGNLSSCAGISYRPGGSIFRNCKNYGNGNFSGISDAGSGKFIDCENHGNVQWAISYSSTGGSFIRCRNTGNVKALICSASNCTIKDCINEGQLSNTYRIFHTLSNCKVKNLLNIEDNTKTGTSVFYAGASNSTLDGMISIGKTTSKKDYYGTDFSGFFYSWKDNRIGLRALESAGIYQGAVDESYLYRNGFTCVDHTYTPTEEDREYMRQKAQKDFEQNYTKLEYLEIVNNSANGYRNGIDSNVRFVDGDKIEFTYKSTDTSGNIMFLCANSITTPWFAGNQSSGFTNINYTPSLTRNQLSDGTKRTITINYTSSSTGTIRFGSWQDSSWSRTIDWYSIKIYKGDNLLRDFVPVMRKKDNVLGLYDKVKAKFYTNQGTGTFIGG